MSGYLGLSLRPRALVRSMEHDSRVSRDARSSLMWTGQQDRINPLIEATPVTFSVALRTHSRLHR
jgi:hypothetical protein